MKTSLVAAALLGSAFAADLTFVSGVNCTGQALYGRPDIPTSSACNSLSGWETSKSVVLANLEPGQKVAFFSDSACENELYSSAVDLCYTEPDTKIRSFQVQSGNSTVDNTDMVPYGIKLSNYKGLSQAADPFNVDLAFSTFALGVILSTLGQVGALSAIAIGCALVDSTNVLSLFGCILGPIASVVSYVGALLVSGAGPKVGAAINQGLNMAQGTFQNIRKRELINEANNEYMSTIMKRDDGSAHGMHIGFQTREINGIEQRSPLYEMDFGPGGKYHVTAFLDERSGTYLHHMHRAEESQLETHYDRLGRRQVSYDDVRWTTNGLDWSFCAFGGSASGFTDDAGANWQTVYDQLNCELSGNSDFTSSTSSVEVDLYNEAGTIIGDVLIIGYKGTTTNTPPTCSNPSASLNEDCIID